MGSRRPLTQVLSIQKEIQGFRDNDSGTRDEGQGFRDKCLGAGGYRHKVFEAQGKRNKGLETRIY